MEELCNDQTRPVKDAIKVETEPKVDKLGSDILFSLFEKALTELKSGYSRVDRLYLCRTTEGTRQQVET
jgi:hypothetical protein